VAFKKRVLAEDCLKFAILFQHQRNEIMTELLAVLFALVTHSHQPHLPTFCTTNAVKLDESKREENVSILKTFYRPTYHRLGIWHQLLNTHVLQNALGTKAKNKEPRPVMNYVPINAATIKDTHRPRKGGVRDLDLHRRLGG